MAGHLTVIHIDDGVQWRGGQFQVSLLVDELRRRDVEQHVATCVGGPLAERVAAMGIPVVDFAFKGELDFGASRKLAGLARERGAHILHAHTAHAHAVGLRAHKILRRGQHQSLLPMVITRRVDFVVGRGWFSRRKYRAPRQHFIAISQGVADVLEAGGVDPRRIDIVHSGVPPLVADQMIPRDQVREKLGIAPGEIAILNIGALTDHKGHRFLIEAAARVSGQIPNARFWILGEGELRPQLERQIDLLGLNQIVRLHGHLPDARHHLAGFDLYVSASHLEGLGTSILDAMLAGLPVVAAGAGGVPDIVRHDVTGRLVPPCDGAALAREIRCTIESPQETSSAMTTRAREFVEQNFSARAMAEGTLKVYESLQREFLAGGDDPPGRR